MFISSKLFVWHLSFEDMNILIKAIFKFCTTNQVFKNQTIVQKFELHMTSLQKWRHFSKTWLWRHYDNAINSKAIFLNNFGKHPPAFKFGVPMIFGLGVR